MIQFRCVNNKKGATLTTPYGLFLSAQKLYAANSQQGEAQHKEHLLPVLPVAGMIELGLTANNAGLFILNPADHKCAEVQMQDGAASVIVTRKTPQPKCAFLFHAAGGVLPQDFIALAGEYLARGEAGKQPSIFIENLLRPGKLQSVQAANRERRANFTPVPPQEMLVVYVANDDIKTSHYVECLQPLYAGGVPQQQIFLLLHLEVGNYGINSKAYLGY